MFDQFVIILRRPRDVRNCGAVVRAMKNMGFSRLRLVEAADVRVEDILGIAHRSDDILARIEHYDDLATALGDTSLVVGTSARLHANVQLRSDIRDLAAELHGYARYGLVALLFGPEDKGLDNEALARCHILLRLPVDLAYPSLNLAQAVLLVLYELRQAATAPLTPTPRALATAASLDRSLATVGQLLGAIDFVKSGDGATLRRELRAILNRAQLDEREAALLTAVAREVLRYVERSTK
ncbi:rRNA methyltransferase [Candidatus Gracilibacteria bacterium]|nr:rRNA methyltransferase [Candidatus Gracilibacteria bacterium]